MNIVKVKLLYVICVMAAVLMSAGAQSDVYRCKSSDGGVVFQQKACDDDQISGNSLQHKAWRQLRGMTASGVDIISRLGADVASIKACKVEFKGYRHKLDEMKPMMVKLIYEHPHLAKSYGYLYECSVCKTSAETFCHSSNRSLDEAMKTLVQF